MCGREYNKIAAGILLAGLIAMITGKIVDILYKPNLNPIQRGYSVVVSDIQISPSEQPVEPQKFTIDIKALMKTASVDAGKAIFTKCAACHTDTKGGAHRVGPNLWDTLGMKKAGHEGYNYSQSLKSLDGEWDYESLAQFLHKPSAYVKGTKMSFAGLSKPEDIANIIAYLRSLSDSPKPLP
jgi:cytochrome c